MLDAIRSDPFNDKLSSSFQRCWIRFEECVFQLSLDRFRIYSYLRLEHLRFHATTLFNLCAKGPISWFINSSKLWAENNELLNDEINDDEFVQTFTDAMMQILAAGDDILQHFADGLELTEGDG